MPSWGRAWLASPGDRDFASRVSGLLWLTAAATTLLGLALPGSEVDPLWVVWLVVGFGVVWGTLLLVATPLPRAPMAIVHVSTVLGICAGAVLVPVTGATDSPTLDYLWFVVVYVAFFCTPRQAIGYWLGCALVHASPLLYDGHATEGNLARELLVIVPTYFLVGGLVVAGRARWQRLSEEHASLRRVATAVAAGSPPAGIFALVSSEAGRLLRADAAAIVRFRDDDRFDLLGRWTRDARDDTELAIVGDLPPGGVLERLRAGAAVARQEIDEPERRVRLAAPVHTGATLWGALVVGADPAPGFAPGAEEHLHDYADLIATAIANAEDRARLHSQAATDALTGLPNNRAFRWRLRSEVARAQRHGRPLTVALIDVDGFRELSDRAGLRAADEVLAEIGTLLRDAVGEENVLARMGGDEFGVVFIESDRHQALLAADRARRTVAEAPLLRLRPTISIGLCDLEAAASADEALRRADAALYWAKEHGRNMCWLYDPTIVRELDERQRTRELDRSHALLGLHALARAIDAKDPDTHDHCEHVAALAARLAAARGWSPGRVALLRDAALLHDVGKIGVPDAILLKEEPLEDDEFALIRQHPVLGARIVADVLSDEQIAWIAAHHERPDGAGYPAGLREPGLPEGATLLALADAWDDMVSDRSYSSPMSIDEALSTIRDASGTQFAPAAVEALESLARRGELLPVAARLHQPTA
jgi:diguanylate cyclase (GGDEF)-like protein/putative nucleotidyltransferase with HDIG domain